jgi:hypothetical protein
MCLNMYPTLSFTWHVQVSITVVSITKVWKTTFVNGNVSIIGFFSSVKFS